ncbi:outer membrane protein [Vibrio sp. THAF190c]|uniref:outer membrane protein n=1 Tax=Vibrio sp. THAF190c TaxID=2587865 RepID=UPI001267CC74|nr:OmpW family outer membrane protein [Vibrio sp. THAF190c]QFT11485.1 OmpW family protein [Vibrio sp. THAF190c]
MSNKIKTSLLTTLLLTSSMSTYSAESSSSFKVLLGNKSLASEWDENDGMDSIGFLFTYQPSTLPIGLALDLYGNGNEEKINGIKTETSVGEANIGLRWQPLATNSVFSPYLGTGISYATAELEYVESGTKYKAHDSALGYWIGGGVDYIFSEQWTIGVDAKFSKVDVKLNGKERDAGGLGLGIALGYRF